jgi:hypothetical protein
MAWTGAESSVAMMVDRGGAVEAELGVAAK